MTEQKMFGLTKFYCTNQSESFRTSPYVGGREEHIENKSRESATNVSLPLPRELLLHKLCLLLPHRVSPGPCYNRLKHSMASCPQLLSLMAIPPQANSINKLAQDPKNPSDWAVRRRKIVVHKRFMLSPANLSSVTSGFQSNRTWFKSLLGYCPIKIPFKCVITVRRKAGKQRWGNFKRY